MSSNLCLERLEKPLQKVAQKQELQKKVILKPQKRKSSQISFENHQLRKKNVASSIQPDTGDESKTEEEPPSLLKRFMTIVWQHLFLRDVKTFQKRRTEPALIEK